MHLIVDARPTVTITGGMIIHVLLELPKLIGMTIIREPEVTGSGDLLCGIVIIAESHITIHVDSLHVALTDVFSCKDFDYERAHRYILHTLHLAEIRSLVIPRLIPTLSGSRDFSHVRAPFELKPLRVLPMG